MWNIWPPYAVFKGLNCWSLLCRRSLSAKLGSLWNSMNFKIKPKISSGPCKLTEGSFPWVLVNVIFWVDESTIAIFRCQIQFLKEISKSEKKTNIDCHVRCSSLGSWGCFDVLTKEKIISLRKIVLIKPPAWLPFGQDGKGFSKLMQ